MCASAIPRSQALHDALTAQLKTVNLQALRNEDTLEASKLFRACVEEGIFYLDISQTSPDTLRAVEEIYQLEEGLFGLQEAELLQYDIDRLSPMKLNGYKPLGRNRGELAENKDGFQSYAIPKDGILERKDQANFPRPPVIDAYVASLRTFTTAISSAISIILTQLSKSLSLPELSTLNLAHRGHLPSSDLIRLLKYHKQPSTQQGSSHIPHTDLGSLTFLFTEQYGLQIYNEEDATWRYVQPRAGCATVNIGDSLSVLTNKALKSCRHRVKALPGQALETRYSFAYFLRPDDDVLMRPLGQDLSSLYEETEEQKETVTSGEWMKRKYAMLRGNTWTKEKSWILTGA